MKKNVGNRDKIIRIILAIVLAVLYFANVVTGVLGIILLILAGVLLVTSFISFCPLYTIFGIKTTCQKCNLDNKK